MRFDPDGPRWRLPPALPPEECSEGLAASLGLPEELITLLRRRGHRDGAAIRALLDPPAAPDPNQHFADLEREMDVLLTELFGTAGELIHEWIRTHRYVTGKEMAAAGLAEIIGLNPLPHLTGT